MRKAILILLVGLFWCNVGFADGCIKGDCVNGQGTYTWSHGVKYVGEWKDRKRHGQGTITYPTGRKYVGEWKTNNFNGYGTLYSDGMKYVGEFKEGRYHGEGTHTSANGDIKEGIWEKGELVQRKKLEKNVVEKPGTKSIPNIANSKWKTTQTKNEWKKKPPTISFLKNGKCVSLNTAGKEMKGTCVWQQDYDELTFIHNNVATYVVKLSKNTWEGKAKNSKAGREWFSYGEALVVESWLSVKAPDEPKPDDDKVVAASMGSGFFVTRAGHLVTNYHVIEECDAVKTNILGKEIRTDIIAIDKTNDLAIIKAEMNPSKVFPVSNEDVSLMQDVIVAGFPLGKKVSAAIKIHKGSVTALAGFGDNYSNFQTDATINQGNSGGPIMNQKGNVVGVAVQLIAAEHAQNVFFGVKSSTLKTFAKANNIKFISPNYREMSNEDLGKLITEATVFLDCWMTVAKIKRIIAQEENRKAFYKEHQ